MITFRGTVESSGKTTTGIEVPDPIVAQLGGGKRPKVSVTINGKTYRSSVAPTGGRYLVGVSAANRELTGVAAGDVVDITLALDDAPRQVDVPEDLAAALAAAPKAKRFFEGLSFSQQRWFVDPINDAKTEATRQRRIDKAIERLASGRGVR